MCRIPQTVLRWVMEKTTSNIQIESPEHLEMLMKLHHKDVIALFVNPTAKMLEIKDTIQNGFDDVMFGTAKGVQMTNYILKNFENTRPGTTDDAAMVSSCVYECVQH